MSWSGIIVLLKCFCLVSVLTLQSSGLAYGQPLTLFVSPPVQLRQRMEAKEEQ